MNEVVGFCNPAGQGSVLLCDRDFPDGAGWTVLSACFPSRLQGSPGDLLIFFSLGPKTTGFRNSEEFAWHK